MPQMMKTYSSLAILLQNKRKMLCNIAWFYEFSDFIDVNIFQILLAVGTSTQLAVCILACSQTVKQFFEWGNER